MFSLQHPLVLGAVVRAWAGWYMLSNQEAAMPDWWVDMYKTHTQTSNHTKPGILQHARMAGTTPKEEHLMSSNANRGQAVAEKHKSEAATAASSGTPAPFHMLCVYRFLYAGFEPMGIQLRVTADLPRKYLQQHSSPVTSLVPGRRSAEGPLGRGVEGMYSM